MDSWKCFRNYSKLQMRISPNLTYHLLVKIGFPVLVVDRCADAVAAFDNRIRASSERSGLTIERFCVLINHSQRRIGLIGRFGYNYRMYPLT